MRQRDPRQKDEKHLAFIRTLPCLTCLDNTATEAAHIRFGDRRAAKRQSGLGEKPHDRWTVPLCGRCHRTGPQAQHTAGEQKFWDTEMIDPIFVAMALYLNSGDAEACEQIIREQH